MYYRCKCTTICRLPVRLLSSMFFFFFFLLFDDTQKCYYECNDSLPVKINVPND